MPYKANEARRHKFPRARYKVTNRPEYDRALQQRSSLTVWVMPEAIAAWQRVHSKSWLSRTLRGADPPNRDAIQLILLRG